MKRLLSLLLTFIIWFIASSPVKTSASFSGGEIGEKSHQPGTTNEVTFEELYIPEIEVPEEYIDFEEPQFIPDYRQGMENTSSKQIRTACSGAMASSAGYSAIVRQDQMLYFTAPRTYPGSLMKIPVGGTTEDAVPVLDSLSNVMGIVEIQVLGDWIFMLANPNADYMQLWVVRTDGENLHLIIDNISGTSFNTIVVKNEAIYYTSCLKEQISASNYRYTSYLYKLPFEGDSETLLTIEDVRDLSIVAYTDDTALLKYGNNELMILDLNHESISKAPEAVAKISYYSFLPGTDGSFLAYSGGGDGYVYRLSPETGYVPDLIAQVAEKVYSGDTSSKTGEFIALDKHRFITNCEGNIREKSGIWLFENGVRTLIVQDRAANLSLPGDGYLYYTYATMTKKLPCGGGLCRIRLDGTGWENLNW